MEVPSHLEEGSLIDMDINIDDLDLDQILSMPAAIYNCIDSSKVWDKVKEYLRYSNQSGGWSILNRQCDICSVHARSAQDLIPHRYKHTADSKFTCLKCHITYSRKHWILRHIIAVHSKSNKPVVSTGLPDHIVHDDKVKLAFIKDEKAGEQCDICCGYFPTTRQLISHRYQHTCDKSYTCLICFKTFKNSSPKNFLRNHFRAIHWNVKHQCNICKKEFRWKSSLQDHSSIHSGAVPIECNVCYKKFLTKKRLGLHKALHTDESRFECEVCFAQFNSRGHFNYHKHIHADVKPFQCALCDKRFADKGNLTKHTLIHTGEKPFKCDICERCFNQGSHLQRHRRTHTGEKPYRCDKCGKGFMDHTGLLLHSRTHTGEKPYKCPKCPFKTSQSSPLRIHMRRIHSIINYTRKA